MKGGKIANRERERNERQKERKKDKSLLGWAVGRPLCVGPTVDQSAVMVLPQPQPKALCLQRHFPQIQTSPRLIWSI